VKSALEDSLEATLDDIFTAGSPPGDGADGRMPLVGGLTELSSTLFCELAFGAGNSTATARATEKYNRLIRNLETPNFMGEYRQQLERLKRPLGQLATTLPNCAERSWVPSQVRRSSLPASELR